MAIDVGSPAMAYTIPNVTTEDADPGYVKSTGNGTITDDGGMVTHRGFVYGKAYHGNPGNVPPESSGYDDYADEAGVFGTGAFTGEMTGLSWGTTYYVRAYACSPAGYDYGDESWFVTLIPRTPFDVIAELDAGGKYRINSTWGTFEQARAGMSLSLQDDPGCGVSLTASWFIQRGYLEFDLSAYEGAVVDVVKLRLCVKAKSTGGGEGGFVTPASHENPLQTSDWGDVQFVSYGYWEGGGIPDVDGYLEVILNDVGKAAVIAALGGMLRLGLVNGLDFNDSEPGLGERYVNFYEPSIEDKEPMLRFEYPTFGLILEQAFDQPIFTASPAWTDVTQDLMAFRTKRGRMHELDKVEAGTAVVALNNDDGDWWRYNPAGIHYPNVKPLTLTRLRYYWDGVYYPIWYGVSEAYHPGWRADNEGGASPIMTLECVDFFKSFARYSLTGANIKLTEAANSGDSHVHLESVDFLHEGQSVRLYQDEVTETKIIQQVSEALKLIIFTESVINSYSANAHVKKFPAVLSGQRIKDCLLEMGVPAGLMDIDAGQHYVIEHEPKDEGTNVLGHMQAVAEAEDGLLFVARDGKTTFQDSSARMASPYNTSQATFNDDDTAQKYVHPSLVDDDMFIYNQVKILGPGIDPQQVVVGDAATEQGPRELVRKESQLYFSTDAFVQAFVLAKRFTTSKLRCDLLLVKPQADPDNLFPVVLGYDISTRITFNLNTADNPAALSKEYHIEGVEHEWDASDGLWQTWWQLWTVNRYKAFSVLHDGYFRNYSDEGTYQEMHDEAEANYVENDGSSHNPYTDPDEIVVGQQLYYSFLGFNGSLWRGFLEFDTSLLLPTDSPIAAFVLMHVKESFIDDRPWNLVVVDPSTLANPLAATDYGVLEPETVQQGAETMIHGGLWLVLELNSSGLNLLAPEGITRFGLRSHWDIVESDNDEEDGYTNEYARFDNINTNYPPRLVIQLAE